MPQGHHRIEAGPFPRRDVASRDTNAGQEQANTHERQRIESTDARKQAGEKPGQPEPHYEAQNQPNQSEFEAIGDD